MRRTCIAAMIVIVVGLASPTAGYAQYGSGTLTVSDNTLTVGQAFTVAGGGYAANSPVAVIFTSDPVVLANVTTNASGSFSVNVTTPSDATAGAHTVSGSGRAPDNSARILTAAVTVAASAAPAAAAAPATSTPATTPPGLVRTGNSDAGTLLIWGTLLIAVGFMAVVAVRRNMFRRQQRYPSWR